MKRGLEAVVRNVQNSTILVQSDNTTALAYLQKKGGTKCKILSNIAVDIWDWALKQDNHLVARHIPGKLNITADQLSRKVDFSDYQLDTSIFRKLNATWGPITIDLFARGWNKQVENFFSWKGHPEALGIDAMMQKWPEKGAYAFPPYIMIPRVLREIRHQKLKEIVIIAPIWKAQCWYSSLLSMSTAYPIMLPSTDQILKDHEGNPYKGTHQLAAWKLSATDWNSLESQQTLQKSWATNNAKPQQTLMSLHGEYGNAGVRRGERIPFIQIYPQCYSSYLKNSKREKP